MSARFSRLPPPKQAAALLAPRESLSEKHAPPAWPPLPIASRLPRLRKNPNPDPLDVFEQRPVLNMLQRLHLEPVGQRKLVQLRRDPFAPSGVTFPATARSTSDRTVWVPFAREPNRMTEPTSGCRRNTVRTNSNSRASRGGGFIVGSFLHNLSQPTPMKKERTSQCAKTEPNAHACRFGNNCSGNVMQTGIGNGFGGVPNDYLAMRNCGETDTKSFRSSKE
jgi:hypothetical protein